MAGNGPTIDLRDAARLRGPVSFQLMVKPGSSRCNLNCEYCYYLGSEGTAATRNEVMPATLLEKVIREGIETNEGEEITFTWHGGEPLLAGLPFYRLAIALQRRYQGKKRIVNTLQTNGTLLTAEWAAFFRDNGFLVGLSLDGPRDIHDAFRQDRGGQPSFDRVMRGLEILRKAGVEFNTLTTVNARSEGREGKYMISCAQREAGSCSCCPSRSREIRLSMCPAPPMAGSCAMFLISGYGAMWGRSSSRHSTPPCATGAACNPARACSPVPAPTC